MSTVYLETSFFSACVSTRTSDKSIGWRASSLEWWNTQRSAHELFISGEVVNELAAPDFPNSQPALEMLRGLRGLEITAEIRALAELLVAQKVMPAPAFSGDAMHVAIATFHRIQYILSWNVKHLANENKRTHLGVICLKLGLAPPLIVTPDML